MEFKNVFDPPPLSIGSAMISPKDGMVMLYVSAGPFLIGSVDTDIRAHEREKPQCMVYLNGYWIDQTPVTNRMFAKFVTETGYQTLAKKDDWSYAWNGKRWGKIQGANWQHPRGPESNLSGKWDHPVVHVNWHDAQAYSQWAERRLPTEAEWEKAARGVLTQEGSRIYPWGNAKPNKKLLNFNNNIKDTTPVGSYPAGASPYGALDMAGNVSEWTTDWYDTGYYKDAPLRQNPQGSDTGYFRVQRGGSWNNEAPGVRVGNRGRNFPTRRNDNFGFRCAVSL